MHVHRVIGRLIAAVAAGASVAGGVAVVLVGFAPAYLAPGDDDRRDCDRRIDPTSQALVDAYERAGFAGRFADRLQEQTGDPSDPQLWMQAVRCGSGVEVGAVPLLPTARQGWLKALDDTVFEMRAAVDSARTERVDELVELREDVGERHIELTREAILVLQDVSLDELLSPAASEASSNPVRLSGGAISSLAHAQGELDDIDAEIARLTEEAIAISALAHQVQVTPPTLPYRTIAIVALLGGVLAAGLVLWRSNGFLRARPRSTQQSRSAAVEESS